MNRFILTLFTAVLAGGYCAAQDYSICSQVIGSVGRTVNVPNQRWAYTVGEVAIVTIVDPMQQVTLTQGFHQPELCSIVSTNFPEITVLDIRVYPNPAADYWQLEYDAAEAEGLRYSVFNTLGQTIVYQRQFADTMSRIDCSDWQPGIYLLQVTDQASKSTGTLRLLKI